MNEPLSPLAELILDCIREKGRGMTQTEIAQAEYELQTHGFIAFGCCSNRFLTAEAEAHMNARPRAVQLTDEQIRLARDVFAGRASEQLAALHEVFDAAC